MSENPIRNKLIKAYYENIHIVCYSNEEELNYLVKHHDDRWIYNIDIDNNVAKYICQGVCSSRDLIWYWENTILTSGKGGVAITDRELCVQDLPFNKYIVRYRDFHMAGHDLIDKWYITTCNQKNYDLPHVKEYYDNDYRIGSVKCEFGIDWANALVDFLYDAARIVRN